MEQTVAKHEVRISQLEKTITENKKILDSIHEMRADMKHLSSDLREFIDVSGTRAAKQGERIGALEGHYNAIQRNVERVTDIDMRLKLIESKDGKKWAMIFEKAIYIIGMIILAFLLNWMGVSE